jgi:hypothetical protein
MLKKLSIAMVRPIYVASFSDENEYGVSLK